MIILYEQSTFYNLQSTFLDSGFPPGKNYGHNFNTKIINNEFATTTTSIINICWIQENIY